MFNRACFMLVCIPSNAGWLLPAHNETFVIRESKLTLWCGDTSAASGRSSPGIKMLSAHAELLLTNILHFRPQECLRSADDFVTRGSWAHEIWAGAEIWAHPWTFLWLSLWPLPYESVYIKGIVLQLCLTQLLDFFPSYVEAKIIISW